MGKQRMAQKNEIANHWVQNTEPCLLESSDKEETIIEGSE